MTKSLITVLSITGLMLVLLVLPASACCLPPYELLGFDYNLARVLKLAVDWSLLAFMLIPAALVSFFVYWKVLTWKSFGQAILLTVITSALVGAVLHFTGLGYFNAFCQLVHSCAGQMLTLRDQISTGVTIGLFVICLSAQLGIYSLSGSRVGPKFFAYTFIANAPAAALAGALPVCWYAFMNSYGC